MSAESANPSVEEVPPEDIEWIQWLCNAAGAAGVGRSTPWRLF